MTPLIGIGCDIDSPEAGRERAVSYTSYIDAVERAGGVVVLIPPQGERLASLVKRLDGILLAGGDDFDPSVFGEQPHPSIKLMDPRRQDSDLALARLARERSIPILGICLGAQVINVSAGGTLVQDITSQLPTAFDHTSEAADRKRHEVTVAPGSVLASIIGAGVHNVNSSHHQSVRELGTGLVETAHASDGVIEAIEDRHHPFCVGVQWHPEDMVDEQASLSLFTAFVDAARARGRQGTSLALT